MKKVEPNHKKKSVRGTRSAEAKSGAPRARGASGAHAAAGPGPCLGLGPHLLRRGSTCSRPRGGRRTPLRARGWGGEATPCWARRRGEVTTGLTRLLGARRLTQLASPTQTSPSEEEPVGMGKAERRRKPRSASLPFLVPAQSVTVTKSPGGETLDAARRRVRAGAWARPQSPRDFCTVCLAIL